MYRDHTVAVVVPAYNEEGFVGEVLETVPAFVDRVYAVDDRSTDGTWEEILRHASRESVPVVDRADRRVAAAAADGGRADGSSSVGETASVAGGSRVDDAGGSSVDDVGGVAGGSSVSETANVAGGSSADRSANATNGPAVVPIRHARNRGVGAAIVTGYRRALADGIDVTAVMAGDGQMDPDELDRLLDPIVEGRAAYAKGNRLRGPRYYEGMSAFRLFGNVTLSVLTKIASGYWTMLDPQNGYTAISREALTAVDLDALYEDYGFSNDLLVALNERSLPIADVAMPAVYADERSHIAYRTFVPRLSWLLWRGFLRRLRVRYLLRDFHPLVGLYALAVVGVATALAALGSAVRRDDGAASATAVSAVVLLVCSTTALLLAMVFDRLANEDLVVIRE